MSNLVDRLDRLYCLRLEAQAARAAAEASIPPALAAAAAEAAAAVKTAEAELKAAAEHTSHGKRRTFAGANLQIVWNAPTTYTVDRKGFWSIKRAA